MLTRRSFWQAPPSYSTRDGMAWAAGYNDAVTDSNSPAPRKAHFGDVGFSEGGAVVDYSWWLNSPLSPGYRLTLKIMPDRAVPLLVLTGDGEYHINIPGKLKLTVY